MQTEDVPAAGVATDEVIQALRHNGSRMTGARLAVLEVLQDADGHLTAQEIHTRGLHGAPNLNAATVYRTLERLQELGYVHSLAGDGRVLYGIAAPGHHHAVCTRCGRTTEIPDEAIRRERSALQAVCRMHIPSSAGLTVHGLCHACGEQ